MKTSIKTCFKCGAEKPRTEFYRHKKMADGHVNKCKECNKKDVRKNRKSRVDYYRAYDRKRGNRNDRGHTSAYFESHPDRYQANIRLNNALRDGRIIKADCCVCCGSTERVVGHHPDYRSPLVVTWLCQGCHIQLHKDFDRRQSGEDPFNEQY